MKLSKAYLALSLTLPMLANAAEKNTTQLEQIIVNATRDPSAYAQTSNNISKLENNNLRQQQPTGVADALKNLLNVDIQGGSRVIAQKPSIRGLSGNRVIQVIDGVRQNFDLAHRGSFFLPASLIQEIEVVKGPSSTLWGSGALGGVVAIKTPSALDLLKSGEKYGLKVRQGYQSANSLSESELSAYAANDKFDALISGYYNDADKLRLGSGNDLPHSGYTNKGGLTKLGWQINDAQRLELSHRLTVIKQTAPENNEAIDGSTTYPLPRTGSVSYLSKQKITDQNTALNYYFVPQHNPYLNTQVTLYQNKTEEKEQRVVSGLQDKTKLTSKGINLRNSSDLGWLKLTYGIDYVRDHAKTERGTNKADGKFRANPYDAKSKSTGIYLLTHLPLFNEKIVFSPSIRYDHFKSENAGTKYTDHRWSPSANLTWQATNWLDLTARYTEAFRAPSMQERFTSGAHFGMSFHGMEIVNTFVSNPNLKPETAKNKEISAKFHFDNLLSQNDKLEFNATYFQNDVKDFINLKVFKKNPSDPSEFIPTLSQNQNVANARLKGFELETHYQTDRLNLALGYGQTRGKDKDTQQHLSSIAADKLTFAINYELIKDKFTVGSRISHYRKQNRVPKDHSMTYDGYTLTDIHATYAPTSSEWSNLRIDFAIENLFDKKYQPAFSVMEGSGRNVKLSLGYRF